MATGYNYRFESFLYPAQVSRIELETGQADMLYIRRRHHQLADERGEQVMLYVYNDYFHRWEYLGKTLPNGDLYDRNGFGPYELFADGQAYRLKKGGAE